MKKIRFVRRPLRMEKLECRRLLAAQVATPLSEFKEFDFQLAGGSYSGTTTGPGYIDTYSGALTSSIAGHVSYDSPTHASGSLSGSGTGSGSDRVEIGGILRACSTYAFAYSGMSDVEVNGNQLSFTNGQRTGFDYTSYTAHLPGCEESEDSGGATFFDTDSSGTLDTSQIPFAAEVGWEIEIGVFEAGGSTQNLKVQPLLPADVDVREKLQGGKPASLLVNDTLARFEIVVEGNVIPTAAHDTPVGKVEYFWSQGPEPGGIIGAAIGESPIYWNTSAITGEVSFLEENIPADATHLLALLDADGAIDESDETNNLIAIPLKVDLEAVALTIVEQSQAEDDQLKIDFRASLADPNDDFTIDVYWSRDGSFDERVASAKRIFSDEIDVSAGTVTIDLSELSERPEIAPFLLLHVDSAGGSKAEGDIEEDDESNNFAPPIDTTVDWVLTKGDWSPMGGVEIEYDVANRFWSPDQLPVSLLWVETGNAAASDIQLDRSDDSQHVSAANFAIPTAAEGTLRIHIDALDALTEESESNNMNEIGLIGTTPTVEIIGGPAFRKAAYDLQFVVHNNAPIALAYQINWQEVAPGFVRDRATGLLPNRMAAKTEPIGFDQTKTFKFSEMDGQGVFSRTWDWIPPENEYTQTFAQLARELGPNAAGALADKISGLKAMPGNILSTLATIKGVIDTFNGPSPRVDEVTIIYASSVLPIVGGEQEMLIDKPVSLLVPPARLEDLARFQTNAATASTGFSLGFAALEAPPAAAAIFASAVGAYFDAVEAYMQAIDPPDPNFQQIFAPVSVFSSWQQIDPGYWRVSSARSEDASTLLHAMAVTRDRALGAAEAGNVVWEARQLEALSLYAIDLAIASTQKLAGAQLAENWIQQLSQEWDSLQTLAATDGLPAQWSDYLQGLGLDNAAIQSLLDALTGATENLLGLSDITASTASASIIATINTSLNDLVEAIRLRVEALGQQVEQISAGVLQELNAAQQTIDDLLGFGIVSNPVIGAVHGYLSRVRLLLLDSNDAASLLPHMEFGLTALFRLQHSAVRPDAVAMQFDAWIAGGLISSGLADGLRPIFAAAAQKFDAGQFNEAVEELISAAALIEAAGAADISPSLAGVLSGYIDFVQHLRDFSWHNLANSLDTDRDLVISPSDALVVINFLLVGDSRLINLAETKPQFLLDVDGDGFVAPNDALAVINHLIFTASAPPAEAEGETAPLSAGDASRVQLQPLDADALKHDSIDRVFSSPDTNGGDGILATSRRAGAVEFFAPRSTRQVHADDDLAADASSEEEIDSLLETLASAQADSSPFDRQL